MNKSSKTIAIEIVTGWYENASRNEEFPFTILQKYQIELVNKIAGAIELERAIPGASEQNPPKENPEII